MGNCLDTTTNAEDVTSTPEYRHLAKMSLTDAMIQYREQFMNFLQQEVSTEYLLCLEAIQRFKAKPSTAEGLQILENFIRPPPESRRDPTIFVTNRTVEYITTHLKENDVGEDLFDDVIEEILDVLEMDLLPRFLRQQARSGTWTAVTSIRITPAHVKTRTL